MAGGGIVRAPETGPFIRPPSIRLGCRLAVWPTGGLFPR